MQLDDAAGKLRVSPALGPFADDDVTLTHHQLALRGDRDRKAARSIVFDHALIGHLARCAQEIADVLVGNRGRTESVALRGLTGTVTFEANAITDTSLCNDRRISERASTRPLA
jgi:hypothetical protein